MDRGIKRIDTIKNYSVFRDFNGKKLDFFEDINIIYGWNYSGKTSFSRLISWMDYKFEIPNEFLSAEYDILLYDKSHITNQNRKADNFKIIVFNSDYINLNFNFENNDSIRPITFTLGEDNINLKKEITLRINKIKELESLIKKNNIETKKLEAIIATFTKEARKIQDNTTTTDKRFNRNNLQKLADELALKNSYDTHLLTSKKVDELRVIARSAEPMPFISFIEVDRMKFDIFGDISYLLENVPNQYDILGKVGTNITKFSWIRKGILIVQSEDLKECPFCGSTLTSKTMELLNTLYSNKASLLIQKIEQKKEELESLKRQLRNLIILRIDSNNIYTDRRESFESLKVSLNLIISDLTSLIDSVIELLNIKLHNKLFSIVQFKWNGDKLIDEFWKNYNDLVDIIHENNKVTESFTNFQKNIRTKLQYHYVAKFLLEKDYFNQRNKADKENDLIQEWSSNIETLEKEIFEIEVKLKSSEKGKDEINNYLQILLNRDDIQIELSNNSFVLKRNEDLAKHLSEGEKSIIAFSYFMTELKNLKSDDVISNYIIIIDDPISSLDSNHITQVSLLISQFFLNNEVGHLNKKITTKNFLQLFLLTHNFEFFGFLKDALRKRVTKEIHFRYFLLKRNGKFSSTLLPLPKSLTLYKSEYVYLFSEIVNFKNSNFDEDRAYIMPNIIRRFLEIYTLIKLPGNTGSIDERINLLIGDINELKLLHTFSHFTSLERITKHNELILKLPDAINELFTLLSKDSQHLKSLEVSI